MDEFTSFDRREEKLLNLLSEGNPRDRLYVYLVQNGRRISPAILNAGTAFEELYEFLRDEYGAHCFSILIRRGKEMILSHEITLAQLLNSIPRKDVFLEIEKLRRAKRKIARKKKTH